MINYSSMQSRIDFKAENDRLILWGAFKGRTGPIIIYVGCLLAHRERECLGVQLFLVLQKCTLPFKGLASPRQFHVFHENSHFSFIK